MIDSLEGYSRLCNMSPLRDGPFWRSNPCRPGTRAVDKRDGGEGHHDLGQVLACHDVQPYVCWQRCKGDGREDHRVDEQGSSSARACSSAVRTWSACSRVSRLRLKRQQAEADRHQMVRGRPVGGEVQQCGQRNDHDHCARAFRRGNSGPSGLGGAPDALAGFSPDRIRQLAVQSVRHSSTRACCVRRLPVSRLCRLIRPCNRPGFLTSSRDVMRAVIKPPVVREHADRGRDPRCRSRKSL